MTIKQQNRIQTNLWFLDFRILPLLFIIFGVSCSDKAKKDITDWGNEYEKQGLVLVDTSDYNISVNLRYSGTNNFVGKDVYGNLEDAYLRPEAVEKLYEAASILKNDYPELKLLIWDAARPRRIQQLLWDTVDIPLPERSKYVANPKSGSIHNYGCAVDLTLSDSNGNRLDMGTDYDDFNQVAHIDQEEELLNSDLLTEQQVRNRRILRDVMTKAGFNTVSSEWWHFDAFSRDETTSLFTIVE